jgi:2-C-methyl-D-erythritol 4-phosphate cytidylyltransferase
VQGGPTRHQSEYLGLQALESEIRSGTVRTVVVHDGVRPFVTRQLLDRVISEARRKGAAIPGLPAGPGVAAATADGQLSGWLTDIWAVQTPQAFDGQLVLDAHRHAATIGFEGTDTSEVVEQSGHRVAVVEGSPLNIKITTSDDLVLAEEISGRFPWSDEAELSAVRLSHL